MKNQEKKTQGGARPGSGRKPLGENARHVTVSISGTRSELDAIKAKAAAVNKTASRYLIDLALEGK